jgi:hypothetical protein
MMICPLAFSLLLLVAPVAAYSEADAPNVRFAETGRDEVIRVWHEPEVVAPGTHWRGFIEFKPDTEVAGILYQICHIGYSCFAPPTPAQRLNGTTWTFDTNDYLAAGSGHPVSRQPGWRVGMRFVLNEKRDGESIETSLPDGTANPDDLEYHYLAFDMPAAEKKSPAAAVGLGIVILLAAVVRRRR